MCVVSGGTQEGIFRGQVIQIQGPYFHDGGAESNDAMVLFNDPYSVNTAGVILFMRSNRSCL
jgi:hypothetical protein